MNLASLKVLVLVLMMMLSINDTHGGRRLAARPSDDVCPCRYKGKCFKMFTSQKAYTWDTGNEACAELEYGNGGHLANIYDKKHFFKVIQHMLKVEADSTDPNVLLGMKYDPNTRTVYDYDGEKMKKMYWGPKSRPLRLGTNMIIRASAVRKHCKIQNFGTMSNRYKNILCEYDRK